MRVGVVGAGVAGALLAWRLCQAGQQVELHTDGPNERDATAASGGLVRGFEPAGDTCRLAASSLAELRDNPVLREAAGYREVGSVYLLPPGVAADLAVIEDLLPGSVRLVDVARLNGQFPSFRSVPTGTTAVVEQYAGFLSPARLRRTVLGWAAADGIALRPVPVTSLGPGPMLWTADGGSCGYDAVVIAAGAWTPALLSGSGLGADGLRTKQIQYSVYAGRPGWTGVFVDEGTGLYGRADGDGAFLLGGPCERWDIDPAGVRTDIALVDRIAELGRHLVGVPQLAQRPVRTVASSDCYCQPSGLELRDVPHEDAVFTFTGGSGGAAKTVLAASRAAAASLIN